jgi:transcriptional regulator with XRE-family HTH domain
MTLTERILELRRAQRISQSRLANKAGISRITVVRLESGDQKSATWQTTRKLAKAFGLTMDEFLRDVEDTKPAVA